MTDLYLAWRNPQNRSWFPVGKLSFDGEVYRFVYTKGATTSSNFIPLGQMDDFTAVYESRELFPLFANRLLSKKRPEYQDFLRWLNVPAGKDDPLTLLMRAGGMRETDCFAVFSCPQPSPDNKYQVEFFCHGFRYLADAAAQRIHELSVGERLYLMPDPQNTHDSCAVALRTDDPVTIVGYCPRYFAQDFLFLLNKDGADNPTVTVKKVNPDAPIQLRLLCSLTAPWPEGFRPCSGDLYQPLTDLGEVLIGSANGSSDGIG